MVIIQAIKSLIVAGRQVTRDALIDAVQGMQYDGLIGHISFDSSGDNSSDKVFSVYEIQSGRWGYLQQING
jgi:branched-chain amino acid transport system substrate-binding protein